MSFGLHTIVAFIVALGVLIVVHEYGHYLVARLCGVKVLRFSVGFGRPLLTRRLGRDQTEWVLAAIPFGGYVKMLDEREAPVAPEEVARAFNRQSVWRRFAIVIAGPLANFLFAIAVYAALFVYGLPEARPVLGAPAAGSIAAAADIAEEDIVRSVDGEAIATWNEVRWRVLQSALQRQPVVLEVENARGHVATKKLDLSEFPTDDVSSDALVRIGLRLHRPEFEAVFGQVLDGGAAKRAGLMPGDRVVQVDGQRIKSWDALVDVVRKRPEKPISLAVERDGVRRAFEVTPDREKENGEPVGRIRATVQVPDWYVKKMFVRVSYGPGESLSKAVAKTWDISVFSLKMLGKMLVGEISWKHLSGPVTIADFAGQSAQMGWVPYVTFLALISISLGVLNLLPIPLLDGGHLMYYAIEIVKGRPVSERAMELGQRVGLALLLVMMAFAFYNDLNRLLTG